MIHFKLNDIKNFRYEILKYLVIYKNLGNIALNLQI